MPTPKEPPTVTDCEGFAIPVNDLKDLTAYALPNGKWTLAVEYCGEKRHLAYLDNFREAKDAKNALDLLRRMLADIDSHPAGGGRRG